jgi:serine/threonine protein kinase
VAHPRYRVIRLLGQGGMGAVYLAEHRHMQRQVALKVMSTELVSNPEAVRRFHQEVTAAARLGPDPHIVAVHDADQVNDLHFLVMEFVEGQSLADYVRLKGPLPTGEACEYIRQAALGLQHACEQGMVHRDIKPHNLMRTPQGQIKVLDFGLARYGRENEKARTQLTQQGMVMGTADYMAPEQASDCRAADVRADVYSLGCTFYHLLTGRAPFPDGTTVEKIIKHAVEKPVPIGALRRDLPLEVVKIVEKMMAKSAVERFQTPREVAEALTSFAASGSRSLGPVTVLPATGGTTVSRRYSLRPLTLTQSSSLVARRIRTTGNLLMIGGYLNGFMGIVMLFVPGVVAPIFGGIAVILATIIVIGAVQMRSRQSYRWAQAAAYAALVPSSICFPITIFFGLKAVNCLSDPQYRSAFPS